MGNEEKVRRFTDEEEGRLRRAFELAVAWHGDQCRKGGSISYLSHLLQVAGLVLEHGGTADQAVAGFLHDALEDAESPAERRRREEMIGAAFGHGVLAIVRACSDTEADEAADSKRPWRARKERYLARLRRDDATTLLVAACDKRHNLGAIVGDVRAHGTGYLDRFSARPEQQLWYFEGVLDAVRGHGWKRLEQEIAALIEELRGLVATGGRGSSA